MPKKTVKNAAEVMPAVAPLGGVWFDSNDSTLDTAQGVVHLPHVTKPWTREAWDRARPWILEQRQKLESNGWVPTDATRTELYVLKRNAPAGAFTDDGSLYLRMPKKFVDFMRSGRDDSDKKRRVCKKKDVSYSLDSEWIWKAKVCNEADDTEEPNVQLDVLEPMENILYLVMCLQPGIARLHAEKRDVIQHGTLVKDIRDDLETPSTRCRALVAESESYTRTLPPAYWLIRNVEMLSKILDDGYEPTLAAAKENARCVTRSVKNVEHRVWEEKVPADILAQIMEERERIAMEEAGEIKKRNKKNKKAKKVTTQHDDTQSIASTSIAT
ncbi:unnamed protein product [Tilletia laevis]|uniref:Uncharacterized protein n=2 Tax=Tilletia TaxID=13289 RepID=A0A177VCI4_9BASI|nr:hypothetical protein CF336_g1036 [Tilletia laevis]KAE8264869.1 hypothetical protein A4X03_0g648 [Tilletia caries]CAD6928188.1 unnamed protein product [Tilletia controversa]KAE8206682.1 hypothetical protein CF335_g1703 [Tilletia laevis]CAD6885011.1 unnamed protein product [Tilletia caries]